MGCCASILDGRSRKKRNPVDEALIAERRKSISLSKTTKNGVVNDVKNPINSHGNVNDGSNNSNSGYEPPKPQNILKTRPMLSAANLSKNNNGEALNLAVDTNTNIRNVNGKNINITPMNINTNTNRAPSVTSARSKSTIFPTRKPHRARLQLNDTIDKISPEVFGKSVLQPPEDKDIYITGWLLKRGHRVRNWKRRFFVMSRIDIKYYVKESGVFPFGVDLKGSVS